MEVREESLVEGVEAAGEAFDFGVDLETGGRLGLRFPFPPIGAPLLKAARLGDSLADKEAAD